VTPQLATPALRTLRQVWAVGRITFAEAVRRKVFVVLGVSAAVILILSPMLPSDGTAPGRIRLVITVCSMTTALVSMLVMLLVGASSLAEEIESKRIYWPATKPVSRSAYLAGKYLGVLLLGGALILAMGVVTVVFVRLAAWQMTGREAEDLGESVLTARVEELPERIGGREVAELVNLDAAAGADEVREMEKAELVRPGLALPYVFSAGPDLRRERKVRFRLRAFSGINAAFALRLKTRDPRTGDWKGGENAIWVTAGAATDFTVPTGMISPEGLIEVRVENTGPEPVRLRRSDGLVLAAPAGPFEWNLVKWLALLFCRAALLGAVVVGGSAFLSFPVTTLLGGAVWLGGYLSGFALAVVSSGRHLISAAAESSSTDRAFSSLVALVCRMLPDFSHYSASRALADSQAISVVMIASAMLWLVVVRGGVFVVVGLVGYRRRELGA